MFIETRRRAMGILRIALILGIGSFLAVSPALAENAMDGSGPNYMQRQMNDAMNRSLYDPRRDVPRNMPNTNRNNLDPNRYRVVR
jgi:hypothetical protein